VTHIYINQNIQRRVGVVPRQIRPYGLVHKKCPHPRALLEFGRCNNRGNRCCYHGRAFDVDAMVLDISGEPEDLISAFDAKQKVRLGTYPLKEYN